MTALPPVGTEIPCSVLAVDTPLAIGDKLVSVDFRGGWRHRVDVAPEDPENSVRLRLVGFGAAADFRGPDDAEARGGVVIEQGGADLDPGSVLRLTQEMPPAYECTLVMGACVVTIHQPGSEPLVLSNKGSFTLVTQLTQYPPRGDMFQLRKPVDFVDPAAPDTVVATIGRFPVEVGGV
ncbi:hypothetical protein [Streptomyces sp. NPDC093223]|uniref:hypothetical protein n=1 Tax=Streptomyces sp. NPDC093223 TaxID=3366033 RepID=UPI0037F3A1DB